MAAVTMRDVADAARVSRALVSLAYREAPGVSPATRRRILETGARLGYTPNRIAARLAAKPGDTVGVFLQDLRNDTFADIYDGIRAELEPAGKHLVLAVGSGDGRRDADGLVTLREARVDVLIAVGLLLPDDELALPGSAQPLVAVGRRTPLGDSVSSDDERGARAAVEHLLGLGHRRITFLGNPPTDGYHARTRGYRHAMVGAGLAADVVIVPYDRTVAADATAALLRRRTPPSAILAHNDQVAFGVLDLLADVGLRAGRDVSVVGYDDSAGSRAPGVALTTVDTHAEELGRLAAAAALRRLREPTADPSHVVIDPTLVVRRTTGVPTPASPARTL